MARAYWACVGLMVVGFVFFLYGANYYNAAVGWAGMYLFILGIVVALVFYVYSELKKTGNQKP